MAVWHEPPVRGDGAVAQRSASGSRPAVTQSPDLDDAEKHSFDETAGGTVERAYSSESAASWPRPYGLCQALWSVSWQCELAVWSVGWQCELAVWQSAADDAPVEIERELCELGADVAATTEAARVEALRRMRP